LQELDLLLGEGPLRPAAAARALAAPEVAQVDFREEARGTLAVVEQQAKKRRNGLRDGLRQIGGDQPSDRALDA